MRPAQEPTSVTDQLVALLYVDLRRLARSARWRVSSSATIQTTALVHEAYLKLRNSAGFEDRQHFMCCAAVAMRQILLNLAREAHAAKRGDAPIKVSLDDIPELVDETSATALLEIESVLERLRAVSARLAQVVECRFFAGYSDQETAEALKISERTVHRDWVLARAWLRRELRGDPALPAAAPDG